MTPFDRTEAITIEMSRVQRETLERWLTLHVPDAETIKNEIRDELHARANEERIAA